MLGLNDYGNRHIRELSEVNNSEYFFCRALMRNPGNLIWMSPRLIADYGQEKNI